jgi:D-alanine-D-alanine ligase-like ATP-grasp enzyme
MSRIILVLILVYIIYIKLNITEHYTPLSNNMFFSYLEKNGYIIDKHNKTITNNNKILKYNNNFNNKKSAQLVLHKDKLSDMLYTYNMSVPKFIKVKKYNEIDILNEIHQIKLHFPLVVKPTSESLGNGVETDIYDEKTLLNVIKISLKKYKILLVEEQIRGNVYRILMFNNKIIDIIGKRKASVLGDGLNMIKTLINKKYKDKLLPNIRLLKYQNVNLDTIIPKNHKIDISNIINMQNGAECERININKVPKINKDFFLDVTKKIDIFCTGIDFISNDIYVPYTTNNGKILELNYKPDINIHLNNEPIKNNFYNTVLENM